METLKTFFVILKMTRCPRKFPSWNRATVRKAFQWADAVQLINRDFIEQIYGDIEVLNIAAVDNNKRFAIQNAVQTLLICIFSSPYLSWIGKEFPSVVQLSIQEGSARLGSDATISICSSTLQSIADKKSTIQILCGGVYDCGRRHGSSSEGLLCLSLLSALHQIRQSNNSAGVGAEGRVAKFMQALEVKALSDTMTLRLICLAMTISPSALTLLVNARRSGVELGLAGGKCRVDSREGEGEGMDLVEHLLREARREEWIQLIQNIVSMDPCCLLGVESHYSIAEFDWANSVLWKVLELHYTLYVNFSKQLSSKILEIIGRYNVILNWCCYQSTNSIPSYYAVCGCFLF